MRISEIYLLMLLQRKKLKQLTGILVESLISKRWLRSYFNNLQPLRSLDEVVSLPCNITFDVIYVLLACNITIDITFDNLIKSIAKKSKKNEDMQTETEIILPTKKTTPTSENTPTRRTKGSAARRLSLENPKPTETPPTTPSSTVNPTQTATIQEPTNETNQQPPSTNIQEKEADDDGKKRKRTETESPGATIKGSAKKQQLDKKGKEPLKKRKRVEKPKNKAEERKKMDKKGKKKVEDDDEDYEIEEPQDKSVKKKEIERQFKSLRAKTIVKPLYEATKTLTPKRKTKIREMGLGTLLDFPFEKIPGKLPYFVIWEVLEIPMGKKKLESDSPREYDDEFLKAFKAQFHGKKYITIFDLSEPLR
ncbi:hypothetical protein Tco_1498835 [Tanacetum coccineum]